MDVSLKGREFINAEIAAAKEQILELIQEIEKWQDRLTRLECRPARNHDLSLRFEGKMKGKIRFPGIKKGTMDLLKESCAHGITTEEIVSRLHALGEERATVHNVGTALRRYSRNGKVRQIKVSGERTRWTLSSCESSET